MPLFYFGVICILLALPLYLAGIFASMLRVLWPGLPVAWIQALLWYSCAPATAGLLLIAADLAFLLPQTRKATRRLPVSRPPLNGITVVLTAYNDEESICKAVTDFQRHHNVRRVLVVSNNSTDRTLERAAEAGAIVFNEPRQGYGRCVCRCLAEALRFEDTNYIALSEGDMTFSGADLDKFIAYLPHAEIVNGTRIVEQLREYSTQFSTFMYYGNFFAGKLLEAKHLGRGTFTDVGTTYKVLDRDSLARLLPLLNPAVNLEFNAHFLDTALANGFGIVECPVTFRARVGNSKGGNMSNGRALKVGLRMIWGLTFGWPRGVDAG